MLDPAYAFKVLANQARLDILAWLKEPERHLELTGGLSGSPEARGGVCVRDIQQKANMSQSTVSHYLQMMQRAGLLEAERLGQWTYYRRNEDAIRQLAGYIERDL